MRGHASKYKMEKKAYKMPSVNLWTLHFTCMNTYMPAHLHEHTYPPLSTTLNRCCWIAGRSTTCFLSKEWLLGFLNCYLIFIQNIPIIFYLSPPSSPSQFPIYWISCYFSLFLSLLFYHPSHSSSPLPDSFCQKIIKPFVKLLPSDLRHLCKRGYRKIVRDRGTGRL